MVLTPPAAISRGGFFVLEKINDCINEYNYVNTDYIFIGKNGFSILFFM